MNSRVVLAVFIALVLYAIYSWISTPSFSRENEGFDINSQNYSTYTPLNVAPVELPPARIISPSGSGAPNERAPDDSFIVPPEEPYDPQEQPYESSDHPNRLRYPERLYGPGLEPNDKTSAVESGIASSSHQATMNAYQVFGPEFAQNGGVFMEETGVIANDSAIESGYSSI
jgi:hypothetical protein